MLDHGRIVETGAYAALARAGGLFARLIAAEAAQGSAPANAVLEERDRLRAAFSRRSRPAEDLPGSVKHKQQSTDRYFRFGCPGRN